MLWSGSLMLLISWRRQIGCYDYDEDDNNDLIGSLDITLRQLIDSKVSGVCSQDWIFVFFLLGFCVYCDRLIAMIMTMMDHMITSEEPTQLWGSW